MTPIPSQLARALHDRYRLESELGSGGMATVYLAQDLKHDRRVAVKVLHPELSALLGSERFLSEIKTTAALQHPHILPLFDSGSAGGLLFYVMPLVEGETLRARLLREKQLPVSDAVRLATEVAGALDYAHRHGVIHRDIKPENILLHEGQALVADFGISLAVQSAGGQRMTQTGLSLGTPQYMSPEQAMGEREITARSDLYALGVVTYEMLTGDPPFTGSTTQAIVARVLTEEPRPIATQRKSVPEHVEHAVLTALEKLPADRFGSAAEFAAALKGESVSQYLGKSVRAAAYRPTAVPTYRLPALLGALLIATGLAAWGWLRPRASGSAPVTRYTVTLPRTQASPFGSRLALSPDGSRLVFVGPGEGGSQLWLRTRDRLDAVAIPGTAGGTNPAFSPDGTRLAFLSDESPATLKVVGLEGGVPTQLARTLMGIAGLAWGADGFLYVDALDRALLRVPEGGGVPVVIASPDSAAGETEINMPDPLPNGRGVLVTIHRSPRPESWMIGVLDLKSGTHRHLLPGVAARYAPNGYLVVVDANGGLSAAPFDQDRLAVTGELVTLAKDVHMDGWQVNLAKAGAGFAYAIGNQARDSVELVWAGENGRITPAAPGWTDAIDEAALSLDGSRVALSIRSGGRRDVWVRRLDNGALNRLTFTGGFMPRWSRDSRTVYYTRVPPDHGMDLAARPADGSSDEVVVARGDVYVGRATPAPDGSHLVFWNYDNTSRGDLMTVQPGKGTVPQPLRVAASDDDEPALSPDGRWLAYSSDENGTVQVYVRPYPNIGETVWQVSPEASRSPGWSQNGRELYYMGTDNRIVGVEIVPGLTFAMGRRRTVLSLGALSVSLNAGAQALDGRFLAMRRVSAAPDLQIVVVQNFLAELRSRVRKQ